MFWQVKVEVINPNVLTGNLFLSAALPPKPHICNEIFLRPYVHRDFAENFAFPLRKSSYDINNYPP